jgi:hypothetical protein
VTTPKVQIGEIRAGASLTIPYSITNVTGSSVVGEFNVTSSDADSAWFAIKPDISAQIAGGATQQTSVTITPPKSAAPKSYTFRLRVSQAGNGNADFDEAPAVTFTITPPPPPDRRWLWIVVAAVVVAAVIGVVAYLVFGKQTSAWCKPGDWASTYGTVHLTCQGSTASGTYGNGTLSGTANGNQLSGTFHLGRPTAREFVEGGVFQFVSSADGHSFTGTWSYGTALSPTPNPWSGTRP